MKHAIAHQLASHVAQKQPEKIDLIRALPVRTLFDSGDGQMQHSAGESSFPVAMVWQQHGPNKLLERHSCESHWLFAFQWRKGTDCCVLNVCLVTVSGVEVM